MLWECSFLGQWGTLFSLCSGDSSEVASKLFFRVFFYSCLVSDVCPLAKELCQSPLCWEAPGLEHSLSPDGYTVLALRWPTVGT